MRCVPLAIAAALCMLLTACGTARRGEPYAERFEASTPSISRGERVFYEHCHQCHTGGEASLGPAINNKPLPGWLMRFQVRHGLGVMPSFSEEEIDRGELDDLVSYLIALRRHPSS